MAFQNSAGGIILDAILTDIGRKYMTQGKLKIVKFALGDDEVDYSFMSGTPSTDSYSIPDAKLPPILEATSNESATINYGLLSFPRPDVLFVPILKINSKINSSVTPLGEFNSNGDRNTDPDIIYLSVNKETTRKLKSDASATGNGEDHIIEQGTVDKKMIVVESGIEIPSEDYTSDLQPTKKNKFAYLFNMSLYDSYCMVYADDRLINHVYSSPQSSKFYNNTAGTLTHKLGPLQKNPKLSLQTFDSNYQTYKIQMIDNKVDSKIVDGIPNDGNEHCAINGPRASIVGLNLELKPEILNYTSGDPNHRYTLFGTLNNDLFGTGNLYDFIDTTIYLEGLSSSARKQIHIRIARYVSA